jgi:hypothetical protein
VNDWLRRAGRGRTGWDAVVTWSVAEGRRGRRWRWAHSDGRGLRVVGLAERLPSGAFGRLELASPSGLLSFHPDPGGGSAHGNVTAGDGVRSIEVDWDDRWAVGIQGDPFGSAVCGWSGMGVVIDAVNGLTWRGPGEHRDIARLECDERGIPILDEAAEWPLEE